MNIKSLALALSAFAMVNGVLSTPPQGYTVLNRMEYRDATNKTSVSDHFFKVVYDNDYSILLYPYFKGNGTAAMEMEMFAPLKQNKIDTLYTAYITKKGVKFGLKLDSIGALTGVAKNVDSLIINEKKTPAKLLEYMVQGKKSVKETFKLTNGEHMECIAVKNNLNAKDPDSAVFYYRKTPTLFSFASSQKNTNKFCYKADFFYRLAKMTNKTTYLNKASFEISAAERNVPDVKKLIEKFGDNLPLLK